MFVQYLLTNTDSTQIVRFVTWDALLGAGREPSETDFKAIFGQDWKQWQHTMEVFTMHGEYRMSSIKMPPEVAKAAVKRLELPVREMRELFVLTRILHQRVPESSASLDALLARGLKSERLREFLLAACIEHDRPQAALAQARQLMEAGSSNAEVYAQAARLRFNREVKRVRLDSRLSAEAVADIRKWCGQALRLERRLAEANDLLALTLAIQPTVTPADAEAVRAIYRLQNGLVSTCPTAVALMIARQRSGDPERARQIAEILSASPYADEQSRHLAKSLIARADKN